jgi:hypothetical protein
MIWVQQAGAVLFYGPDSSDKPDDQAVQKDERPAEQRGIIAERTEVTVNGGMACAAHLLPSVCAPTGGGVTHLQSL